MNQGKWWQMPPEYSQRLLAEYEAGRDGIYAWDWGVNGRQGSFELDGEATSWSRYKQDLFNGLQENLDNGRKRSVRIVYVRPQDMSAACTGEMPSPAKRPRNKLDSDAPE